MPIRMSGMISGLDTEALVKELVSAYSTKKDNIVKAQTKHEWKIDAWKEMNKKIYGFYSTKLANMKLQSSFSLKSSTISKTSAAEVKAGSNATNGTHSLKIKSLASSAYMTGGVVDKVNGEKVSTSTKLTDMGIDAGSKISIGKKQIEVTEDMNVGQFVAKLKEAGVNASYDATNQRFFVSAKNSGVDGEFALMADNADGIEALTKLGLFATKDLNGKETTEMKKYRELAALNDGSEKSNTAKAIVAAVDKTSSLTGNEASVVSAFESERNVAGTFEKYKSLVETFESKNDIVKAEEANVQSYKDALVKETKEEKNEETGEMETKNIEYTAAEIKAMKKYIEENKDSTDPEVIKKVEEKQLIVDAKDKLDSYESAKSYIEDEKNIQAFDTAKAYVEDSDNIDAYNFAKSFIEDADNISEYEAAKLALNSASVTNLSSGAVRITGQDSEIELNGAKFTSSTGTFSINGLNITAKEVTGDEAVSISVATDTKGMYDKIKDFIKGYNELMEAMDTAYNADSAGSYEPLTDEEKEAMSEKDVEKWETKIKDSLLRRDSLLGNVSAAMKNLSAQSYIINGQKVSLADFGIATSGYLATSKQTRGLYHIDGDADDAATSGKTDKLMAALNEDPDKVVDFFTKLSSTLYDDLTKKMGSSTVSSIYTVYNDKAMNKETDEYKDKVKKWEEKLADIEETYYKKFSAMEKALSELQSKTTALQGLLGMGQ